MADAERAERAGEAAPLLGGGGGEAGAELRVPGVDAELPAGLRVDEPELAGVRQLLLARVADLDGEDVVPAGELEHRPAPVERAAEVGDDDDERPLAGDRPGPGQRLAERRRADRTPASSSPRSAASRPTRPTRPCRGGSVRGLASPNETTPSRLPRRVATWPIAIATPSATSALRRSAVPNRIEGDVSRTSQVTRTRSATCTRTCGSPVRAVTFQSIRRTSSPSAYGRICASSVPSPCSAER